MQSVAVGHAEGGPMTTADGVMLVRAYQSGDRAALERLLSPFERPLYRVCLGILMNPDDAEDAVQETFLRALRGLEKFRGDSAVGTWLHRIAVNVCLEWRRKRRPAAPLADMAEQPSASPDPERTVQTRFLVMEALASLPAHQRAAIVLQAVNGMTMGEIATVMGWSTKKVENELYRARRALEKWRANHE